MEQDAATEAEVITLIKISDREWINADAIDSIFQHKDHWTIHMRGEKSEQCREMPRLEMFIPAAPGTVAVLYGEENGQLWTAREPVLAWRVSEPLDMDKYRYVPQPVFATDRHADSKHYFLHDPTSGAYWYSDGVYENEAEALDAARRNVMKEAG